MYSFNIKRGIVWALVVLCVQFCTLVSYADTIQTTPQEAPAVQKTQLSTTPTEYQSSNSPKTINKVEVVGANSVTPSYILTKFNIHNGDTYNPATIQAGLKSIYELGFFTDRMKAVPVENPDGTINLKLVLEENLPVTNVTLEGNTVVSTEELMSYLTPLIGQPQNIGKINNAIENLNNCYSSKGYILARVKSIADDPDGTINIDIVEGKINKILISGNKKTKDYVIARNIMTEPGMVYNDNLVKKDLVRLYSTQAFKDVNRTIDVCEDDPDKFNVTIDVQEQRTATISVGGGLDSNTGIFGSLGISDNNFRGLNQRLSLSGLVGSGIIMSDSTIKDHMNLQGELSFFEPYFLNADNSLMSRLYYRSLGSYQVPLALEERIGIESTMAHKMKADEHLSSTLSLGLEKVNVMEGDRNTIANMYAAKDLDIADRAKQLEGGFFFNVSPGLIYDTRDSSMNPRNGVLANIRYDESFCLDKMSRTHGKLSGMIKSFIPIASKSSLSFTARAGGKIHGDNMPEVMAYRLGGPYNIRGYKVNGVGTGDAFVMGSVELATPVLFLDRLKANFFKNLRLTFFVDAGKVFKPYITDALYDRPMQAITAGVGLKLYIPGVGPLSVDYGIPLTNPGQYGSKGGYFTFGVGDMMY